MLFLAHNGIAKPEIWRTWRASSGIPSASKRILFFGLMPMEENDWIRIPLRKTGWCEMNLVFAMQDGLRAILKNKNWGNITCIYFLSGQDLPMRSALTQYNLPDETRFCYAREGYGDRTFEIKGQQIPVITQWVSLNHRDARILAEADFASLRKMHVQEYPVPLLSEKDQQFTQTILERHTREMLKQRQELVEKKGLENDAFVNRLDHLLALNAREIERAKSNDEDFDSSKGCPDETMISAALFLSPETKYSMEWSRPDLRPSKQCIVALFKPEGYPHYASVPSPVTWNSWTQKFATNPRLKDAQIVDLETMIKSRCDSRALFFRKVSKELADRGTWKICDSVTPKWPQTDKE